MKKMASSKQLSESLECPICHDLLSNPKLLPCSHSFCTSCLTELHSFQPADSALTCPVCRQDANVPGNDVSNFPTNLIVKSLVEDFKRRSDAKAERIKGDGEIAIQTCTVCDGDDQDIATYYCQNCSEFICEDCLQHHNRYKRNACHETVKVIDIMAGVVKKKFTCPEHPQELQQFVCTTCLVRICCRCREVEHKEDRHEVIAIAMYEENQHEKMAIMLAKIDERGVDINNYLSVLQETGQNVKSMISQRQHEIEIAYDTAEEQLRRRRDELLNECSNDGNKFYQELQEKEECINTFLVAVSDRASLVNDGLGKLYQPDLSLTDHAARWGDLESFLTNEGVSSLLAQSSNIRQRAESLTSRMAAPAIDLNIGTVLVKDYRLEGEPKSNNAMAIAPRKGDTIFKKEAFDDLVSHPSTSTNITSQAKPPSDSQAPYESPYDRLDLETLERKLDDLQASLSTNTTPTNKSHSLNEELGRTSECPDINRAGARSRFSNLVGQYKRKARIPTFKF
ncbi:E3 ubiquitin-protein ligase TRIM33-like [Lytechinus variegatus]|uniref:E3 ubiquitin-protein ligase TRIM33-like n=1 Tax=Lytechinus variegatus TaxID=7654 RepID=UPI001BB0F270|nr:E3 ubiquitin-protein ligase TRIM33-like [Lytechinus variegatus]